MQHKRITIAVLAERLGLSKGSVSKALKDSKEIAFDTRVKVKALATELGYQPSAIAQAIRSGSMRSVGLVLRTDGVHNHKPFLSSFLDGISRRLGKDGYTLTLATASTEDEMLKAHANLAATKSVDAFVLPRTMLCDKRAHLLNKLHIPFVMYGRTDGGDQYAWYDINQEGYFSSIVDQLIDLGHREFLYLGGDSTYYYEKVRRKGFLTAVEAHSNVRFECIDDIIDVKEGRSAAFASWSSPTPATAIVCALDRAALGALHCAQSLGLKAGADISIIGYDGIPEGEYSQPPLSTCVVDNFQSGYQIAEMLLQQLSGKPASSLQQLGEAKVLLRGTTGPAQQNSVTLAQHLIKKK
jgi:LacI family transcriptional regulator